MGLFDFVADLVGDVVEGAVDLAGDVVDGVRDGVLGEAVEEVVETGAGVATGAVVGFVGGVKKGINKAGKNTTKRLAKAEPDFENSEEWAESEIDRMQTETAVTERPVEIKASPANELLITLKKLRETEDRKIDQIKKSGDNMMANVTESLFSSPKRSKLFSIAKSISGKTNEEKLNELRDDYDEKRAKCIDRVIVPIDTFEMWEMYEAAIRLVKQPGMGVKEKTACRDLLERVIEECEVRFSNSEDKFALIKNSKQKYLCR